MNVPPRLLALDAAYSLAMLRARRLEWIVLSRDLDGYFEHVWTVNPTVGASPEHEPSTGKGRVTVTPLSPRHTFVEGKVARFRGPAWFEAINLLVAQAELLLHLHRLVRRHRISLVSANDPYYLGLLGVALARINRIPLVVTVVANYDAAYSQLGLLAYPRLLRRRSLEKRIEHFVFGCADMVAVGSEDNRRYALDNGARPERTSIFRYGDLVHPAHLTQPADRPSLRAQLGLGEEPVVIAISRLLPVKHPEDLIRTLAIARERVPSLIAVLVGDGPMRGELEALAADLGAEDAVVFAGARDQVWIANALTSADVVFSAMTGRALVEASLSGTPIVTYDAEWQSEFIDSGENGLVVGYRQTGEAADAVCRLLTNRGEAARLAANARSRTLEQWDPKANAAERRLEIERLLERSPGARRRVKRPRPSGALAMRRPTR